MICGSATEMFSYHRAKLAECLVMVALALRRAALSGLGIAKLPRVAADQEVQAGRLAVVSAAWQPPTLAIHALDV
ncbi:LysR family domain-containing protein [Rhizobium etli bv. mimosae str. Mim1]|nr:LysR family domain-containing protein [Rhizobium etli bv. mimosae str. Mim1]